MATETKNARQEIEDLYERFGDLARHLIVEMQEDYGNLAREHKEITAKLNDASKRAGAARLDGDDAAVGAAKAEVTELQAEARTLQEAMAELHRRMLPVQASAWLEEADELIAQADEQERKKREYNEAVAAALAELERVSKRRWKPERSGSLWVDQSENLRSKAQRLRSQATRLQREIEAA